jgi:hypothetical protein
MRYFTAAYIGLIFFTTSVGARAQNAETRDEIRGSEFVRPISCVETTFRSITDRFGKPVGSQLNFPTAGMDVTFANGVTLVAYSVSEVALRERSGDHVQLCFLGHVEGTQGCITAADPRGRVYRVYDYRLHAAWTAMNSQHACGGA